MIGGFQDQVSQANRDQYERFPYPGYPLFFRPKWQSGYMGASWFCRGLARSQGLSLCPDGYPIALLGCGDTQPLIARHLEPPLSKIMAVDVAPHSLRRAQWRCCFRPGPISWHCQDMDHFLESIPDHSLGHCDGFGVLHHLANPSATIRRIGQKMAVGATLRLMVYNSQARQWIRLLQQLARLSGLHPKDPGVLKPLRTMLAMIASHIEPVSTRINYGLRRNPASLIDAFLHVREVRQSLHGWLGWLSEAGLEPFALFDRHGELDHIANPMWKFPDPRELDHLAATGLVRGNWEIYLVKRGPDHGREQVLQQCVDSHFLRQAPRGVKSWYPAVWRQFDDLSTMSSWALRQHWSWFFRADKDYSLLEDALHGGGKQLVSYQRLARLGAVLPTRQRQDLYACLSAPMKNANNYDGIDASRTIDLHTHGLYLDDFNWWHSWAEKHVAKYGPRQREVSIKILKRLSQMSLLD